MKIGERQEITSHSIKSQIKTQTMRKTFQVIVAVIVWIVLFWPFWVPDMHIYQTAADVVAIKTVKYQKWASWYMGTTIMVLVSLAFWQLMWLTGQLYDWHTKQILKKD